MNNDLIFKIYKRTLIVGLIIIGCMFFLFEDYNPIVMGYIFGLIINLLMFKLMDNNIKKAIKMHPLKARGYTIFHYIMRYLIYFMVLSTAALADYLNFLAAALGLVMIKFVIVFSTVIDKDFTK